MLRIFSKKQSVPKVRAELATISVPDIKEYLLKEYERSCGLEGTIEVLRSKLDEADNLKIKYDATLVTLDEYTKRIGRKDEEIIKLQNEIQQMKEERKRENDELNSYRIRINDAALTKSEIIDEVIADTKAAIIEELGNHKGNLSKTSACIIVKKTKPYWEGESNNE